ncbi:hypothetical protein QFZ37_003023 [Chryseobacterium ginsenosidimutans]|uniref:DUF2891 domain-containing protein n=1 Tax=Chryseobacterium ginsenosidimutans TaxID=687846 RepID=UPI0027847EA2|nr:DUF2891 domain-containing protein [Chryseobacterium ginsenosidimutans]MDQ0594654.1 hypothetical protein [Chryseobacterium ginsenosidimutans]
MKKSLLAIIFSPFFLYAQEVPKLTDEMAIKLSEKPLHCINQEYPNKTAHIINTANEVSLSPKDLHPAFYGCFDWHSSVHGHWMLVRLLKTKPNLPIANDIEDILDHSFKKENLQAEADYFTKYQLTTTFERTYGWAWLLKLDEELATWDDPKAKIWHQNLKPLTDKILSSWKTYLPKQTYPNRTGVHPNTAFAMVFALDWARANHDKDFENQLIERAKYFYLNNTKTPAYLEPDGSDFFSPSLEIADLMRRVLPQKDFVKWLNNFYEKRSLENIEKIPIVSDLSDYQTVHLVGLSFTKAWCMKGIAKSLPDNHHLKKEFQKTSTVFLNNGLPLLFQGNYGGDHWLASFAVYALED